MASVVMCNMHNRVFESFCRLFESIGITVYCPDSKAKNFFRYDGSSAPSSEVSSYAIPITEEECLDIKPDIVLCSCWEQIVASKKLASKMGSKLVVRAGNNNVPYTPAHSDFLISSDIQTYNRSQIKNKIFLLMPPNYNRWRKSGTWDVNSMFLSSYVHYYQRYWKESWLLFNAIRKSNTQYAITNFGYQGEMPIYNPVLVRETDIYNMRSASRAVIHIKEKEGYGWSLLESIAMGIPVIAYEPFCVDKTCYKFLQDGVTCKFISKDNMLQDFKKVVEMKDEFSQINQIAPTWIRDFISIEQEGEKLSVFLESVL